MKPEELSKQKYLYAIYKSSDELLHIEKYPVIYANRWYVYFKTASKNQLTEIDTCKIKDRLKMPDLAQLLDARYYYKPPIYTWTNPELDPDIANGYLKAVEENNRNIRIKEKEDELARLNIRYARLTQELEKLRKEKADEVV